MTFGKSVIYYIRIYKGKEILVQQQLFMLQQMRKMFWILFLQCTMYVFVQLSTKNMYVPEEAGWDNIELDIVKEKQINHR